MSNLVVSLVRGSVRTAYGAARHPISTASQAVGLATGAVRLGVGVVHGRIPGSPPEQGSRATAPAGDPAEAAPARAAEQVARTVTEAADRTAETVSEAADTAAETVGRAAGTVAEKTADTADAVVERTAGAAEPTEPSTATAPPTGAPVEPVTRAPGEPEPSGPVRVPTPDEIAVRAAGPMPGQPGEAFSTEPKVASREVEHGGSATGDREAVDGFLDEMAAGEPESPIDAIGTTTGPADPGEEAAVLSESETLQRAAERNPDQG